MADARSLSSSEVDIDEKSRFWSTPAEYVKNAQGHRVYREFLNVDLDTQSKSRGAAPDKKPRKLSRLIRSDRTYYRLGQRRQRVRMTGHYRVCEHVGNDGRDIRLCEVAYDADGKATCVAVVSTPTSSTLADLKQSLNQMIAACELPVLPIGGEPR
jgi:hypothetical protein